MSTPKTFEDQILHITNLLLNIVTDINKTNRELDLRVAALEERVRRAAARASQEGITKN
jgi:hypothetical protein